MTRHPASDERSVLTKHGKGPAVERFFASDLAEYLRVTVHEVAVYARSLRIQRFVRIHLGTYREREAMWVNKQGARAILSHFRAKQGASYQAGKDWVAERAKTFAINERQRARKRQRKAQARAIGDLAKLIGGPVTPAGGGVIDGGDAKAHRAGVDSDGRGKDATSAAGG